MDNKSDKKARNGTFRMSQGIQTFDETVLTVIDEQYGRVRNGAKLLAHHAKCSVSTAKHWIYGRRVPSGDNLVNLMAECDAMMIEIEKMVAERRAVKVRHYPERGKECL